MSSAQEYKNMNIVLKKKKSYFATTFGKDCLSLDRCMLLSTKYSQTLSDLQTYFIYPCKLSASPHPFLKHLNAPSDRHSSAQILHTISKSLYLYKYHMQKAASKHYNGLKSKFIDEEFSTAHHNPGSVMMDNHRRARLPSSLSKY